VLDVMMPGTDGLDVLRRLRTISDVYVILLTARSEEVDKLVGLSVGADDYVTKPFSPRELVARVRAVLRRSEKRGGDDDVIRIADLVIDLPRMRVARGGEAIDLTPTEFQIVAALARHPGRVFTRAQLLDAVRGSAAEAFDRAIDSHIKNIRRKLGPTQFIESVYGIGYRLADL